MDDIITKKLLGGVTEPDRSTGPRMAWVNGMRGTGEVVTTARTRPVRTLVAAVALMGLPSDSYFMQRHGMELVRLPVGHSLNADGSSWSTIGGIKAAWVFTLAVPLKGHDDLYQRGSVAYVLDQCGNWHKVVK